MLPCCSTFEAVDAPEHPPLTQVYNGTLPLQRVVGISGYWYAVLELFGLADTHGRSLNATTLPASVADLDRHALRWCSHDGRHVFLGGSGSLGSAR